MNTIQIDKILRRNAITKRFYIGCFASDRIPLSISTFPFCMVVNTDPSMLPGSHWIAIFCSSPSSADYFDSLGFWPPFSFYIKKYLSNFTKVSYNNIQIQQPGGHTCGKYAVFFLFMRCSGFSIENIILILSRVNADRFVSQFIATKAFNINN